jgi:hypothetical protein
LFQRVKSVLKGQRFEGAEEVAAKVKTVTKNGLEECFQKLYECWSKMITAEGKYSEGNVL